ncbi:Hypothetical protein PMT_2758 [Prochlorococcus marinus str. MIT 9313]|uniref:Uncharacterized protein n=1 Tax=Prochlorococcus marinus (strain MIT 9313) TaxID=74547 RepID=B9ESD5_PROMM|nr:Hypothetical protein PMT_2758 [Prochlorococcus marinus str. MIT 9313]
MKRLKSISCGFSDWQASAGCSFRHGGFTVGHDSTQQTGLRGQPIALQTFTIRSESCRP